MGNKIVKYFLFIVLVNLPLVVTAQSSAAVMLQQQLSAFHTMTANFHQIVTSSDGTVLQDSTGKVTIVRPGKFRWVTEQPLKQIIITDGKIVWLYDPDLKQVIERKLSNSVSKMPIVLLTSTHVYLKKNFVINQLKSKDAKFELIPKDNKEMFDKIILVFKNKKIAQLLLANQLGQQTLLTFTQVKLNTKVNKKLFTFKPPKGVDVVSG